MMVLSIDRFEGSFAICEDDNSKMFAIDVSELPRGAKEGDIIVISDLGEISIDEKETERRRMKIKKMQDSLWK